VNVNCTWPFFLETISKLYDSEITSLRITYRDEEGDDIAITSDDELLEAIRLAGGNKPPILRVLISNGSIGNNTESRNLLHSVVTSSSSTKVVPGYMGSPKEKTVDLGYMVSPKEKTMDLGYVVGHKEKSMDFGYVEKPENNPFIKPVGVEELISVNPNI
jgi:hypothetical protein